MPKLVENPEKCGFLVEMLKALAHPIRLQIIATLCDGPECVNDLAEKLNANQAVVSQQLRILRMSSLVTVSRKGTFSIYDLAEPHLRDLIDCMDKCCQVR